MDELDRAIVNRLQNGFPLCAQPFAEVAAELGTDEAALIARLEQLLERKVLTRFGPMYHAEKLGGALSLAAMQVPGEDFERVAQVVNALPQVAHNYQREHAFNMWFVLATETADDLRQAIARIERETGYAVFDMPKQEEYFVELKLTV